MTSPETVYFIPAVRAEFTQVWGKGLGHGTHGCVGGTGGEDQALLPVRRAVFVAHCRHFARPLQGMVCTLLTRYHTLPAYTSPARFVRHPPQPSAISAPLPCSSPGPHQFLTFPFPPPYLPIPHTRPSPSPVFQVRTNAPPRTTVRGPGETQVQMIMENVIEHVAALTGLQPQLVRERNMMHARSGEARQRAAEVAAAAAAAGKGNGVVEEGVLVNGCGRKVRESTYSLDRIWGQLKEQVGYDKLLGQVDDFNAHNRWVGGWGCREGRVCVCGDVWGVGVYGRRGRWTGRKGDGARGKGMGCLRSWTGRGQQCCSPPVQLACTGQHRAHKYSGIALFCCRYRKRGVSMVPCKYSLSGGRKAALVSVHPDGSVVVAHGGEGGGRGWGGG